MTKIESVGFYCSYSIEDQFHFILICPVYEVYRENNMKPYHWKKKPSKLLHLFTTKNVKEYLFIKELNWLGYDNRKLPLFALNRGNSLQSERQTHFMVIITIIPVALDESLWLNVWSVTISYMHV